ncbi:MAG: zinc protease [Chlamydiales bacterium]|jgi:zinc protease
MKFERSTVNTWILALALAGACAAPEAVHDDGPRASSIASAAPAASRPWAHEDSDIPVDERIHFGVLDNGLRWAWAANPRPEERAYLRLHVDVGSLAEQDSEQGMAHFLEHMAFNGSKNFAPGTLIEWFQEHGMAFGADTNAHTGFSETVYKLDLPQGNEETLREGLLVLRDFADGLLIEAEEVENEKGVIDGEQRERDSAGFRVQVKQLELMFVGTRIASRIPIGKKNVRDAFSAESVRAFYERWYRPDNMTLVLVGDLGEFEPQDLFDEYFADMLRPASALPAEPAIGQAQRYDHAFALHEAEIPSVSISVERLERWEERPQTVAEWVDRIPLNVAHQLLGLRFRELAKQESAPFLGASVGSASAMEVFDGETLRVACVPERWEEALGFCEQELRRAIEFGFQQAELDEIRADVLRQLDESVRREPTASSRGLLAQILEAAEEPSVPTDAATDRSVMKPVIEGLTVEACHAALREAWSRGELSIHCSGNLDLGQDGGSRLTEVYSRSAAVALAPPEEIVVQDFAYASDPDGSGQVVEREHIEDLDFVTLRLDNGVAVNIKQTDFKEQQILISANFGEGLLTLEPERSVLNWVASRVFNSGGLEAHSEDDLRRLTAGKQVGVGFRVGPDAFSLGGSTTSEDLLLQCELMCAYLKAPGWREDGRVQLMRQVPLYFESLLHQHMGPFVTEFKPALFAGDARQSHPEQAEIEACSMQDVRGWLAPQLADAPIELSIVGDLDLEQTIGIVARTFGALPARREWRSLDERRNMPAPLAGLKQEHVIETQVPKSLVVIAFPFADGLDPETRRRGNVLGTVVNDRLRLEVRERLGAAYSPGAGVDMDRVHAGVGTVMIQAMADPDKVDTLVNACLDAADSLATEGITTEEADRLREPMLRQLRDGQRTNGYWMAVLGVAQRRADHLDDVRGVDTFYTGYTAEDIVPLAAQYLGRDKASVLIVNPAAGAESADTDG